MEESVFKLDILDFWRDSSQTSNGENGLEQRVRCRYSYVGSIGGEGGMDDGSDP